MRGIYWLGRVYMFDANVYQQELEAQLTATYSQEMRDNVAQIAHLKASAQACSVAAASAMPYTFAPHDIWSRTYMDTLNRTYQENYPKIYKETLIWQDIAARAAAHASGMAALSGNTTAIFWQLLYSEQYQMNSPAYYEAVAKYAQIEQAAMKKASMPAPVAAPAAPPMPVVMPSPEPAAVISTLPTDGINDGHVRDIEAPWREETFDKLAAVAASPAPAVPSAPAAPPTPPTPAIPSVPAAPPVPPVEMPLSPAMFQLKGPITDKIEPARARLALAVRDLDRDSALIKKRTEPWMKLRDAKNLGELAEAINAVEEIIRGYPKDRHEMVRMHLTILKGMLDPELKHEQHLEKLQEYGTGDKVDPNRNSKAYFGEPQAAADEAKLTTVCTTTPGPMPIVTAAASAPEAPPRPMPDLKGGELTDFHPARTKALNRMLNAPERKPPAAAAAPSVWVKQSGLPSSKSFSTAREMSLDAPQRIASHVALARLSTAAAPAAPSKGFGM